MRRRAALLLVVAAFAFRTAAAQDKLKPFDSFWFAEAGFLTPDRVPGLTKELKEWRGVFDAFAWRSLPPTFEDPQTFIRLANSMDQDLGGHLLVATFPVGKEGWETSYSTALARQGGWKYDAAKAVTQAEWLGIFQALKPELWAWVLERPAAMPSPDQAAASATEFIRFAKAHHKKVIMWLSTNGLRGPGLPAIEAVCKATRDRADYFVWMDLPGDATIAALGHRPSSPEEGRASPAILSAIGQHADKILTLCPKDKVAIQWTHSPILMTQNVEGTRSYIAACQRKGINRFVLFAPLRVLQEAPWREFYRSLGR